MTSYASKEMNIMGAKAFVDSVNESDGRSTKNSTILYAVLGKTDVSTNQMLLQLQKQSKTNTMIFGKMQLVLKR